MALAWLHASMPNLGARPGKEKAVVYPKPPQYGLLLATSVSNSGFSKTLMARPYEMNF